MAKTLAEVLQPASVDWKTLHKKYDPLLNLVRELIGVIPNCDPILEIWPPGFRTYNLLVPNMFNLPNTLLGNKSFKATMGLAMYASSKAACAYCTAHTCSFALRRGASIESIVGLHTDKEQAVVTLAEGLAQIPSSLSINALEAVRQYFSSSETEWLIYSISMMGFLNKFMNAVGVELEQEAIDDTAELLSEAGWQPGIHARNGYRVIKPGFVPKDNLFTYLRVMRQAPGAVIWEKKWTRNVPSDYDSVAGYLELHTGSSFPILKPIKEKRVIRALTTVLRNNLDKEQSVTGLKIKMYAGYIFCSVVRNQLLASEISDLSARCAPGFNTAIAALLDEISHTEVPADSVTCKNLIASLQQKLSLSEKKSVTILLAIAASHTPAQNNDAIIDTIIEFLEPGAIVETIVWLSILQLLNRLTSYYSLIGAY